MGDLLTQPDLAATLEAVATQGRDGFNAGRVADSMLDVTDARAARAKSRGIKRVYDALRGRAT